MTRLQKAIMGADESDALADMAERLQDLASEFEGFVRSLRR